MVYTAIKRLSQLQWEYLFLYLTENPTSKSYHVYILVLVNVLFVKHKFSVKKLNKKRNTYTLGFFFTRPLAPQHFSHKYATIRKRNIARIRQGRCKGQNARLHNRHKCLFRHRIYSFTLDIMNVNAKFMSIMFVLIMVSSVIFYFNFRMYHDQKNYGPVVFLLLVMQYG